MAAESPLGGMSATAERGRVFSIEKANRTLPLVRRIVQDVVAAYGELRSLKDQLADSMDKNAIEREMEGQSHRLEQLQNELGRVGCELKDPGIGLVDFPGRHQSRDICLCWKLGEEKVAHWHELHAGAAGRRPVSQLEEQA
jgi:hypothetical protein